MEISQTITTDFTVANHGSIFILTGITPECKEWIEQNVGDDETQHWFGGIVVEPRYVQNLINALESEGFKGEIE